VKYQFNKDKILWLYDKAFPKEADIVPKKFTMIEITSEMIECDSAVYEEHKLWRSRLLLDCVCEVSKKEMDFYIGVLAYHMLCDKVLLSSPTHLWYCNEGMWESYFADAFLWNYITNDLINFVQSEGAGNVALHIKTGTTRGNIMRDLKLRMLDDRIESLLDSKRDLIYLQNGVYNTRSGHLRNAVPADLVSMKTDTALFSEFETSRQKKTLMRILRTIFPDNTVLQFFIDSCSLFLEGYNSNKLIYIWWGRGNNAKTLIQRLVSATFGQYCNTAPTSLITGKRTSASNATPDLCHVDKRLVVFLQEPNPDEKLKAGMVKEMTGNDIMYTRQLFKSPQSITLRAKIVLVCNNMLEIPGMDSALKRRFVVLPFLSTFLSEEEYALRKRKGILGEHCHIINNTIEKQLLSCKEAFLFLLCSRYVEKKDSLHIPPTINEWSERYLSKHNYPQAFIQMFMRHEINSCTTVAEVYELFKSWFKRAYPGKRVADFDAFTAELENEGYVDTGDGVLADTYISYFEDVLQYNIPDNMKAKLYPGPERNEPLGEQIERNWENGIKEANGDLDPSLFSFARLNGSLKRK
jgi:P4 family phage/plasmid primase-like protien